MNSKETLAQLTSKFKNWLAENWNEEEIRQLIVDDAGYPFWQEIESFFSELISSSTIQKLDNEDLDHLLYLIARNWDIGSLIAWLSAGEQLSNCGELTQEDFVFISKRAAELSEREFFDAKSQLATSFKKFNRLTPEMEEILLNFYWNSDEYTKRLALISLGKHSHPKTLELLELSWENEDEHHKMGCLYLIDAYIQDAALMKKYLKLAEPDKRKYISDYVKNLKKNTKYG